MYDYPHYKENDRRELLGFMQAHPFALLIGTRSNGRIECTQLPLLVEEREGKLFLLGHIARKSSHHLAFDENPEVLALFTGPHTYVSATLYTGSPHMASTWNYVAVHARGRLRWTSEEGLTDLLQRLSLHFEDNNKMASPVYANLPEDYRSKLVKAIVGFEMEVTSLENVYKLSQNRDEKSYDHISAELQKGNEDARQIGEMMAQRRAKVFPGEKNK